MAVIINGKQTFQLSSIQKNTFFVIAFGGLYSSIYINSLQSQLIIFVYWTQLLEYWTHNGITCYMLYISYEADALPPSHHGWIESRFWVSGIWNISVYSLLGHSKSLHRMVCLDHVVASENFVQSLKIWIEKITRIFLVPFVTFLVPLAGLVPAVKKCWSRRLCIPWCDRSWSICLCIPWCDRSWSCCVARRWMSCSRVVGEIYFLQNHA